MTRERNTPSESREPGDPNESGWLALKRFPGQKIFIFTEIGRLSVTLLSLGPDEPELKFELLDRIEVAGERGGTLGMADLSQKIAIAASVDEENPNRAKIAIKAPRKYPILRGEFYQEDRK